MIIWLTQAITGNPPKLTPKLFDDIYVLPPAPTTKNFLRTTVHQNLCFRN